jgi:hypothetical protein
VKTIIQVVQCGSLERILKRKQKVRNRSRTDEGNWSIGSREENKQLFWWTMN